MSAAEAVITFLQHNYLGWKLQGGRTFACEEIKWIISEPWLLCDRRSNEDILRLKSGFPGDLHFASRKLPFSLITAAFLTCRILFNRCSVVLSPSQDPSFSRTSRQPQKIKWHMLISPFYGGFYPPLPSSPNGRIKKQVLSCNTDEKCIHTIFLVSSWQIKLVMGEDTCGGCGLNRRALAGQISTGRIQVRAVQSIPKSSGQTWGHPVQKSLLNLFCVPTASCPFLTQQSVLLGTKL